MVIRKLGGKDRIIIVICWYFTTTEEKGEGVIKEVEKE